MSEQGWFLRHSIAARIIFILILLYAICSINVLFLVAGIVYYLPKDFMLDPFVLIIFTIISFCLVVITSAYHLSTMILRRKRRTDWQFENNSPKEAA
jgi:predicted membrane protein